MGGQHFRLGTPFATTKIININIQIYVSIGCNQLIANEPTDPCSMSVSGGGSGGTPSMRSATQCSTSMPNLWDFRLPLASSFPLSPSSYSFRSFSSSNVHRSSNSSPNFTALTGSPSRRRAIRRRRLGGRGGERSGREGAESARICC